MSTPKIFGLVSAPDQKLNKKSGRKLVFFKWRFSLLEIPLKYSSVEKSTQKILITMKKDQIFSKIGIKEKDKYLFAK